MFRQTTKETLAGKEDRSVVAATVLKVKYLETPIARSPCAIQQKPENRDRYTNKPLSEKSSPLTAHPQEK